MTVEKSGAGRNGRIFGRLAGKPASLARRMRTDARFIKNWAGNPLTTGAIAPSGSALARRMASFVPLKTGLPVLEIGPGTGAVTRALLDHGVLPEMLTVLEYNAEFCAHIAQNFPGVRVVQGDAYGLTKTLTAAFGEVPVFAAIVSSLPLLTRPREERDRLLRQGLGHLAPGAPFIQFSYGFKPPVDPGDGVSMKKTGWILRNIPPARVYVYR